MEGARYRKRYEAELAKAAKQEARREAAPASGLPVTSVARAQAIKAAPVEPDKLGPRVDELLATLRDPKEPAAVRVAALDALAALDFLGPRFAPFRAEYKQALRDVVAEAKGALRESALELLAMDKDPFAQDLLVRGLENPEEAVVPEPKALQFLGYDDHADVVPLARKVLRRATTDAAREEAVRVLATDPRSRALLTRLLKDKSEQSNVRRISAAGLQSLDPDAFERAARKIVTDETDYDEIRAASLAALAHGREARDKPADPKLVDAVQKLSEKPRSRAMRSSIQRFLRSTE
jgi:hypothetical protein